MKKITVSLFFLLSGIGSAQCQGWFPVGNGFPNNGIATLCTYDSVLYAGGIINNYGANGIAQWNGTNWSALGVGVNNVVLSIFVYGGKVYVGGEFDSAGGKPARGGAIWDGHSWSSIKLGSYSSNIVYSFAAYNGELYMGGYFDSVGGKAIKNIARWNGTTWNPVGQGVNQDGVGTLIVYDGKLYVSGGFDTAGGIHAEGLATWNGTKWDSVPHWDSVDLISGPNDYGIAAPILSFDSVLYIGGTLPNIGWVCQWNDINFAPVGRGANASVYAAIEKNGLVYMGGEFDSVGHVLANQIAVWNGNSWSPLGSGMSSYPNDGVGTLAFYNGSLYAAGSFYRAGGYNNVNNIAVWGDSILGIANMHNIEKIKIYPNPNHGQFTLLLSNVNSVCAIKIYNVLGEKVYSGYAQAGDNTINLPNQPNGVYLYCILTETGELVGEGKMVIEK